MCPVNDIYPEWQYANSVNWAIPEEEIDIAGIEVDVEEIRGSKVKEALRKMKNGKESEVDMSESD